MSSDLSGDMAIFIWYVMSEPVITAIAAATVFTTLAVIASFFNFLSNK